MSAPHMQQEHHLKFEEQVLELLERLNAQLERQVQLLKQLEGVEQQQELQETSEELTEQLELVMQLWERELGMPHQPEAPAQ